MSIKVIQWATGTVGIHAVPAIAAHPDLELAGLWVHSDSKAGRDAGELCGGPAARRHRHPGRRRPPRARRRLRLLHRQLRRPPRRRGRRPLPHARQRAQRGEHLVRPAAVPRGRAGDGVHDRLAGRLHRGRHRASTRRASIPGFGNAGLTIHALALCKEVRHVRMMEIVNYATWDNPFTMFEIMGFGKPDPHESLLLVAGVDRPGVGPGLELVAAAIGLELDEIIERHEVIRRRRRRRDRLGHGAGRRPSRACASRSSAWSAARSGSSSSTSPGCATRTLPTGPRARATASS